MNSTLAKLQKNVPPLITDWNTRVVSKKKMMLGSFRIFLSATNNSALLVEGIFCFIFIQKPQSH